MSAEYKVTKGIYMRKYQAKNIWEVGGACVEKQRIQRNFARCLNPPCEIFARYFFMVRNGQISHHEENPLAKFWQGEIHLAKLVIWQGELPLLAKWCSHCLCSCFHLKFKPVNVQNPCLTRPSSSSIN